MLPIAVSGFAAAAHAEQAVYDIDIAKGSLNQAMLTLSAQTGASFGYAVPLPQTRVRGVRGRMSIARALSELLRNTGVRAVAAGPGVFRLISAEPPPASPLTPSPETASPEITVTGRKRTEALADVGAPMSVYVPDADLARVPGGHDTQRVAAGIPALTTTNTGEGADRIFIRGVADSPFLGFSQSTVAIEVDDARIAYDGPDPDLKLVDIERVEVLEGPQGPLYGTGALGGVYRIVPRKPVLGSLEATLSESTIGVHRAGIGIDGQAIVNVPLVRDKVAIRAVGYIAEQPGWIGDVGLRPRANASHVRGERVTVRVAPGSGWTIDLSEIAQSIRVEDSQYVDRETDNLARRVAVQEPHSSDFALGVARAQGALGPIDIDTTTSMSWHVMHRRYDASAAAASFGVEPPATYDETRHYRVFDQEIRLSGSASARWSWLAGASYLAANSAGTGWITSPASTAQIVLDVSRATTEAAVFGEGAYSFDRFQATLGARLFSNNTGDELVEADRSQQAQLRFVGVSPSLSLSWHGSGGTLIYARYASAVRPGGITPGAGGRYDADTLGNFDLGARLNPADGRLKVNLSLFRSLWKEVQSDYLLTNGLIASHNVGDAAIYGGEWSLTWAPNSSWRVETSGIVQSARLVRATSGAELPEDTRLPVVPDLAGTVTIARTFEIGSWSAEARATTRYTGPTRLSFDAGLNRRTPAHAELSLGLSASSGPLTIRASLDNATDNRADTFGFGNPFSVAATPQFTPLQPRTLTMGITLRH